jgi:hypothetical protein
MAQDLTPLINLAKTVLDLNWTGHYTQPGPRLYPHQWSWDSASSSLWTYDQKPFNSAIASLLLSNDVAPSNLSC